jgi:hypothetical protein
MKKRVLVTDRPHFKRYREFEVPDPEPTPRRRRRRTKETDMPAQVTVNIGTGVENPTPVAPAAPATPAAPVNDRAGDGAPDSAREAQSPASPEHERRAYDSHAAHDEDFDTDFLADNEK